MRYELETLGQSTCHFLSQLCSCSTHTVLSLTTHENFTIIITQLIVFYSAIFSCDRSCEMETTNCAIRSSCPSIHSSTLALVLLSTGFPANSSQTLKRFHLNVLNVIAMKAPAANGRVYNTRSSATL